MYNAAGVADSNTATVTVQQTALSAPANLNAIMQTTTSVQVSWTGCAGAQHYEVCRRELGGVVHKVGESTTTAYTDNSAGPNTTYVYQVCASPGSGTACTSPLSNQDIATTMLFSSVSSNSPILLVHVTELLAAVNAVRAASPGSAGAPVTWEQILQGSPSQPVPTLHGPIYGENIMALRRTMDAALQTLLGITPPAYTDPTLPGSPRVRIKAIHVTELRSRAQ